LATIFIYYVYFTGEMSIIIIFVDSIVLGF